ncbi:uncharacterized protein LOC126972763 isoform X2 [Leptidea sinapis]|uniref:uncharacterized protein LOC126972763 isoform X2 n=1 Tax=Leptidea sinapis TaxID=189913 RepID=UPI0021C467BA|nr:uncharacterized protein LOC126972763 isoform X2 [Leptidea sinapis]
MDTCVRGFSYMPEKLEATNLKYVDNEALEQTWKSSRRERKKQQEQKIWEEFVKEQDIINSVCADDPYQFINQLSEDKIKELLEAELEAMRMERKANAEIEELKQKEILENSIETGNMEETSDNHHVVFMEEKEADDGDVFHIYGDDKDDDVSGPEDEVLSDATTPPPTVREKPEESREPAHKTSDLVCSTKSSENVTSVVENSIYCAKVKELRAKIDAELNDIILTLETKDIVNLDPTTIPKIMKRSTEFCSRFSRNHLYQLSRQIQDLRRHNSHPLPFAKNTHFQSQIVRVASLHQNSLHALQIFHKSIQQTACMGDSGDLLKSLLQTVLEMGQVCGELVVPPGLGATNLYLDAIQFSCEKLQCVIEEYTLKLSEFLNSTENTSNSCSKRSSRLKTNMKSAKWSKPGGPKSFGETEPRLSMYSLDLNLHSRSNMRDNHSGGTSKVRACISGRSKVASDSTKASPRKGKKTPRVRRPLMRDPQVGQPRCKPTRESDVTTLVESVANCESSHISPENSPLQTPKDMTPRRRTIKKIVKTNEKSQKVKSTLIKSSKDGQSHREFKKATDNEYVEELESVRITSKRYIDLLTPINILPDLDTAEKAYAINDQETVRSSKMTPRKNMEKKSSRSVPKKDVHTVTPDNTPRKNIDKINSKNTPRKDLDDRAIDVTPIKDTDSRNKNTPRHIDDVGGSDTATTTRKDNGRRGERVKKASDELVGCEVSKLLWQLCGGDSAGSRQERVSGAKNAQLVCVSSGSPRQPSTPQLLRILEETIQKKTPRSSHRNTKDLDKFRMNLNIPEAISEELFQYRTKFILHMLTSSLYANSAVHKPWEVIGRVSEEIIDELLLKCADDMQLNEYVTNMYKSETC